MVRSHTFNTTKGACSKVNLILLYNESTNTLTVDNFTVTDTLVVTTTTTLNSNTVTIGDSIIVLNSDETGASKRWYRDRKRDFMNVQLVWDETNDQWDFDTYSLPCPLVKYSLLALVQYTHLPATPIRG